MGVLFLRLEHEEVVGQAAASRRRDQLAGLLAGVAEPGHLAEVRHEAVDADGGG